MSRLDPETNQWLCKIVLFAPPSDTGLALTRQLLASLPSKHTENSWDTPVAGEATLVARYKPATTTLNDIKPLYSIHALRTANSSAVDRQHLLGNVDGVVLLLDANDMDSTMQTERELERCLGMFGKMIATLPTVLLSNAPLSEDQQSSLNPNDKSLFVGDTNTNLQRALTTLIGQLEQDSGFAGFGFDLDDIDDDLEDTDWDDIEFDDLHAYDDDEE